MATRQVPTLALRKVNESEYVNVRTYWTLTLTHDVSTYELRVVHRYPEDEFMLVRYAEDGERWEVMDKESFVERCQTLADNEGLTINQAAELLGERNVAIADTWELDMRDALRRHWDALTTFVRVSINSFSDGWRNL